MSLTQALVLLCGSKQDGLKTLYLANRVDIDTAGFTLAGGEYTAVAMAGGAVFFKMEFLQDTGSYVFTATVTNSSPRIEHTISVKVDEITTAARDVLQEQIDASSCGMVAIIELNDGTMWVVGYSENHKSKIDDKGRPLRVATQEGTTGTTLGEGEIGTVDNLLAANDEHARKFTGSVPV